MASSTQENALTFPSGRSVGNCRKDAKKLTKAYKHLSLTKAEKRQLLSNALDSVAAANGIDGGWAIALEQLKVQQRASGVSIDTLSAFKSLSGRLKEKQADYRQAVLNQFEQPNGELLLPDGEGGLIEAFPHKGTGMLITSKAAALIEADLKSNPLPEGPIELVYEKPGSSGLMGYSIQLSEAGVVVEFCRWHPSTKEADFYAQDWSSRAVGFGDYQPVNSMLHWLSFTIFHKMMQVELKPRA